MLIQNLRSGKDYIDGLRCRLTRYGISFGELSRTTGIHLSQISRWMNKRARPGLKSIERLEAGFQAIAHRSADGEADILGDVADDGLTSAARERLDLMREYIAEFRYLVDLHDRTPARWKYFQTEWMWLFVRGMLANQSATLVKERRLAELKESRSSNHSTEITELTRELMWERDGNITHYAQVELSMGPGDGEIWLAPVTLPDVMPIRTKDLDGNPVEVFYKKESDTIEKIVAYPENRRSADDWLEIQDEFYGSKPVRYVWCSGDCK